MLSKLIKKWKKSLENRRQFFSKNPNKFTRISKNSFVSSKAQVLGWSCLTIGERSMICDDVCININLRDNKDSLVIGECVFVGRRSFFSTGEHISIEDYCLIGADCKFLNAGHARIPETGYVISGIETYPPMIIELNVWLTMNITLIGGIKIGYGSIIAANSLVTANVPPLCMAAGSPAKIKKLYDWQIQEWVSIDPSSSLESQLEKHLTKIPNKESYSGLLHEKMKYYSPPLKASGTSMGDIF